MESIFFRLDLPTIVDLYHINRCVLYQEMLWHVIWESFRELMLIFLKPNLYIGALQVLTT